MQIKENYHVTQIKDGIIKYVDVNVKIIMSEKNIIVGILPHVFVKIVSIYKVFLILQWLSVMNMNNISTKKEKYYSSKCSEYCFNKLSQ